MSRSQLVPVANAICVEQLLASSATCVGITVQDKLAYSLLGLNQYYPTLTNPKAADRVGVDQRVVQRVS